LDDDVAARLKAEARRTGKPFKEVVNESLRAGLARTRARPTRAHFSIKPRDLGRERPGISLDNIGAVLEQIEGPLHR
jgi:hypothetical protein